MDLISLGWSEHFARAMAPHAAAGLVPARVALEHKHAYVVFDEDGERTAELPGRLLKGGRSAALPAVGDWVAVSPPTKHGGARIQAVLPRRTQFSRRAAGERTEEQVVAANIDTVFLVNGLDGDYNPRRIERYLTLTRASGARPVVLLNKADLCVDGARGQAREIAALAGDAPVVALSAEQGTGLEDLAAYLGRGQTVALLGSSGAGKSTIVNRLLGEERQAIGAVRAHDQRGKHTTTRRELVLLPGGAVLVDTPGMRELQLWDNARDGLAAAFPEIIELGSGCRFRDCRHESEPGCAVLAAVAAGAVTAERFASFVKLRSELEGLDRLAVSTARRGTPRVHGRRIMRG